MGFLTLITLPASSSEQLFAMASSLFDDLWLLIVIAIGVPLFFYLAKKVIGLIPKGK